MSRQFYAEGGARPAQKTYKGLGLGFTRAAYTTNGLTLFRVKG